MIADYGGMAAACTAETDTRCGVHAPCCKAAHHFLCAVLVRDIGITPSRYVSPHHPMYHPIHRRVAESESPQNLGPLCMVLPYHALRAGVIAFGGLW